MDLTTVKVIGRILNYHGVSMCLVGEFALNYYNVPRVCHDLEICVPKSSSSTASDLLCSTGLFETCDLDQQSFNNFTEHKRGFPRIQTTGWTLPQQAIVIYPDSFHGLNPLKETLLQLVCDSDHRFHISKELAHLNRQDIAGLPLPRLAPFLKGLAHRYLASRDDMALIAVEQLVDGMNLDQDWVTRNFAPSDAAVIDLVMKQVDSKQSRIDYVSENLITCFVTSMIQGRLNDAAIVLHRVLDKQQIAS
ncbi:hypothetical protein CP533_2412 [Ophiocordyceps camponoti-saundersi (nom. inval.)]|nr:hypothetical protein CP533_2412 [Ophiocordyceps camponoti-saundersi (nom. inval.)]